VPNEDVADFYEHERVAARSVAGLLQRRYNGKTNMADDKVQMEFIREAKGIYAEQGLVAHVEMVWRSDETDDEGYPVSQSPTVSDDPDDKNLYFLPRIQVVGRVDGLKQFDHDRQKHEIRAGMFDGVKGVIDPNTGQMKDEPKSKIILP
jgi:hypothetical protein